MTRLAGWLAAALVAACAVPARGEAPPPGPPRGLAAEIDVLAYLEASWVWNLTGAGRDDVNELRVYDFDAGFTFNTAELSVKKAPSERYPFGFGLVLTAGLDSQKNHVLGMFRDRDDEFPFRNTRKYDVLEAYASYRLPLGRGLTLTAGKFGSPLGYEAVESPLNLNVSRGYLFGPAGPLAHVGALASYPVAGWLEITAGPVVGWDVAEDNNSALSWTGVAGLKPRPDLAVDLGWITGPEQDGTDDHPRTLLDLVVRYTGVRRLTLALNADYGWEPEEAALAASGTRRDADATWWGWALYAGWDWAERFRTAGRLEYFTDLEGVRTGALGPGRKVSLWAVTATVQYRLWRGLVGRLEFRHDAADGEVFRTRGPEAAPTSRTLDTLTVSVYYSLF
jgi:hypothetical protein